MTDKNKYFEKLIDESETMFEDALENLDYKLHFKETGKVTYIGEGITNVNGLNNASSDELLRFKGNVLGVAFNLDPGIIGAMMLDDYDKLNVGDEVYTTGRVVDVPVGDELLGRIIDPLGRPLDDKAKIKTNKRDAIEKQAPNVMDRAPVKVPLQTGLKVIDSLIPIGRGQRELILGDRQTGKSAIAIDTILNQHDKNVICVYCSIGQKSSDVSKLISTLRERDAIDYSIVVVAHGEDAPGLQYIAPYAATTIAEYFMEAGKDALIVYDDLTHHARAYRELSLLMRRPPAREAYPGDIFYIHSRLLERATHLNEEKGGGSLTALPIIETHAQNISAYIPTNLISITDGQIYLNPNMFYKGTLPAIDVGESVSRVGGKSQLAAFKDISGDLRLSYSQFRELESFSKFSTKLDEETRKSLERGKRVREILKQDQYSPMTVPAQIAVLLATSEGLFDDKEIEIIREAEKEIIKSFKNNLSDLSEKILNDEEISEDDKKKILDLANKEIEKIKNDNNSNPDNEDEVETKDKDDTKNEDTSDDSTENDEDE